MRIGIIGGGASGLACAWLLDDQHDVTLFEKDDRLGGHAHTVEIDVQGQHIAVDAGFQFFSETKTYAMFNRLLDALEVPRRAYPATLTVYRTGRVQRPVALPPFRSGGPVWSSLTPSALCTMVRLQRFLSRVPSFLELRDTTVTIAEYLERQRLPRAFVDDFLIPLTLSFWCVERADFLRFAAYNGLYYLGANRPTGIRAPVQSEIPGGMKVYVDALVRSLRRTEVRLDSAVTRISRDGDGYVVDDDGGRRHEFDHVVIATSAEQAASLVGQIPELEPLRRQLSRFEYFDTTIAIHGDRRLMPHRESTWSVVNARWDGAHSSLSIWDPARGLAIFKSWITFDGALPEPLYALVRYRHGRISPDYFDAQRKVRALQGEHRLWLAGLYTEDADSHESAIRSAVSVAQQLAPESPRLRRLLD